VERGPKSGNPTGPIGETGSAEGMTKDWVFGPLSLSGMAESQSVTVWVLPSKADESRPSPLVSQLRDIARGMVDMRVKWPR
jgi:hypothetical protein